MCEVPEVRYINKIMGQDRQYHCYAFMGSISTRIVQYYYIWTHSTNKQCNDTNVTNTTTHHVSVFEHNIPTILSIYVVKSCAELYTVCIASSVNFLASSLSRTHYSLGKNIARSFMGRRFVKGINIIYVCIERRPHFFFLITFAFSHASVYLYDD